MLTWRLIEDSFVWKPVDGEVIFMDDLTAFGNGHEPRRLFRSSLFIGIVESISSGFGAQGPRKDIKDDLIETEIVGSFIFW